MPNKSLAEIAPLTATDIAAMKQADRLIVAYKPPPSATPDAAPVRCEAYVVKDARRTEKNPFSEDQNHIIPCDISIARPPGNKCGLGYQEQYKKLSCFAHVWLYPAQMRNAESAIRTLHIGDKLVFAFKPDYLTNGGMKDAGLHGDLCCLEVYRKDKLVGNFDIDHCICADNTARMVRGIPADVNEPAEIDEK